MGKFKNGLNSKIITVINPETDEELDLYVSYEVINEDGLDDDFDEIGGFSDNVIDIKHFEPNDDVEMGEWVNEDLVYESLLGELDNDLYDDELLDDDLN